MDAWALASVMAGMYHTALPGRFLAALRAARLGCPPYLRGGMLQASRKFTIGSALAVVLGLVFSSTRAAAQEPAKAVPPAAAPSPDDDPTLPAPVPPAHPPAAVPNSRGILFPAEKTTDLQAHWNLRRDYVRDRDEHRADDEVQKITQLKDELSIENLFAISSALVRESQDARAAGAPDLAKSRCKLAVDLSPDLPEAHSCLARSILAEDATAVKPAFAEVAAAMRAAAADPRLSHATLANAGGVVFFGLLAAGLAFVLLLFARYAQLYVHDVHHLFPAGARHWQTRMLAAVLVASPLLLQMGAVPLLFTVLFACALYASVVEVVISCVVLVMLAASPFAAEGIARLAAFGGPATDVFLIEHGESSPVELTRLRKRMEAPSPEMGVAFALARKAKREGDLPTAESLYRKALENSSGASSAGLAAAHNNLGNVYLLEGDSQKAMKEYESAASLQESLAAPHFNMSRALGLGGVEALAKVQSEQARALELDREAIDAFTGGQLAANHKSNKFVMDVPLDDSLYDPLLDAESAVAAPVGDEVRAILGGPLPTWAASGLPIFAGLVVLALHFARAKVRPSGRCERCGREVCKRCDADARPSEALCAQCVNVFIRRTGVDAAERIRKEHAVQAYQRRRTLLVRALAVVSGAGHVLLGYPLRGIAFLLLTGCLAASLFLWRGLTHDPVAVRATLSLFRVGLTIACFVGIYALCLRDLLARQRAETG